MVIKKYIQYDVCINVFLCSILCIVNKLEDTQKEAR